MIDDDSVYIYIDILLIIYIYIYLFAYIYTCLRRFRVIHDALHQASVVAGSSVAQLGPSQSIRFDGDFSLRDTQSNNHVVGKVTHRCYIDVTILVSQYIYRNSFNNVVATSCTYLYGNAVVTIDVPMLWL